MSTWRRVIVFVLLFTLLTSQLLVLLPGAWAEGVSRIYLVIQRVRELDQIETITWPPPFGQDGADWYFRVQFYDGKNWRDWEPDRTAGANNPDAGPLWEWYYYEFETPLDLRVRFRILLYDHDMLEFPDLADISSKIGEGVKDWDGKSYYLGAVFEGVYNLETHLFTGDGDYVEKRWYDKVGKYVWVASGEFDGSYGAIGLDAEVWFQVFEELPDEIKPWLDQNGNGIPDYLDVSSFKVIPYSVDKIIIPFGSFTIDWPVDLQIIYPANTQEDMLNQLRSWGVDCLGPYCYVLPIIFDVNITSLASQFSMIFPNTLLNYLKEQSCWDGRLRLLSFFALNSLKGYGDHLDFLVTLKQLLLGSDITVLENLLDYVDISFYVMRYNNKVVADKVIDLRELFTNKLVQLLIDWIHIIVEIPMLPANVIDIAQKVFSFIVDYTLDYLPIPSGVKNSANWIKGVLNSKDPPEIRLDLKVQNASSGELLLGYDDITGKKLTSCSINDSIFGLWFEDVDKQIFIIAKSLAPYNISISCSGPNGASKNLTYSFVLFDPQFTESYAFGGILSIQEQRESQLTLGPDNKTQALGLRLWSKFSSKRLTQGDKVQIDINVTDTFNNPIDEATVTLYISDKSFQVAGLGDGKFRAIVDTSTLEGLNLVYMYATKTGYLDGVDVQLLEVMPPQIFKLVISTTSGGITNPTPGTYTYTAGSQVQVTAIPSSGYVFDHWELNGTNVGTTATYTVTMNANYILQAFFRQTPPPLTVSITPMTALIFAGQQITFTSTVSGGFPPYTYQWYLNGNPVSGATSDTWTFKPATSGIYYVQLQVTDAQGNMAQSEAARIVVQTVPVGGYSVPFQTPTKTEPILPYIAIITALTITITKIRNKTKRR